MLTIIVSLLFLVPGNYAYILYSSSKAIYEFTPYIQLVVSDGDHY